MKIYKKYIIIILILIFNITFSHLIFSEEKKIEEVNTSIKKQKDKVRNKLNTIEENFKTLFITESNKNLRKSNKLNLDNEEKLKSLLESDDYFTRIWSSMNLYKETKEKYPVVKEGENWDSFIDELLNDLEIVTTDVPREGYINMEAIIIEGSLVTIGDRIIPKITNSLNNKNKNSYFRVSMLRILQNLNEEIAINEALRILNQDIEDEIVERNAVIILGESNNNEKIEHLKKVIEIKNKGRARDVAIVQLERLEREGNEKASEVLKKLKDNGK